MRIKIFRHIYIVYKKMASWDPVDISQFDRDEIKDVYDEWDADFRNDLEVRYNKIRKFKKNLNESTNENDIEIMEKT